MSFPPQEVEKIYNQLPCGYHSLDEKGIFVYINDIELQMLGYSREEVVGHHFSEFVSPESLPTFQDNFPLFKQRGWVDDLELQMIRKDGTILPVAVSATAIRDEAGNFLRSHSILIDISDRKKVEASLRHNQEMFSALVDNAPFGIYLIDAKFRLQRINQGSEAAFSGIDPLIGRDFAEIVRIIWQEPFATEVISHFHHTLVTGESYYSPVIVETRANIDEIQSYDWQIHRLLLSDGSYGVVCYFYELSEIKRAEEMIRQTSQRDAFLVTLYDALRPIADSMEIQAVAAGVLGEFLRANRVIYIEVLSGEEEVIVRENYTNGVAPLNGRYRLEEYRRNLSRDHQAGRTQIVTDIANDPKYTDAEKERYSALNIVAHIDVPLLKNGQFVALLAVHQATPRQWTETEVKLVEETAEQTWSAVERACAEAAVTKDLQDTQLLCDLSAKLLSETNIEVLYNEIVEAAIALTRSDMGSLQLLDRSQNELHLQTYRGFHPDAAAFWQKVRFGEGSICSQALEQGERVIVSDIETCDSLKGTEALDYYCLCGIRAVQSSPLISCSGQLIGMVSTHWRQPYQPSDRKLRFLDLLARQAADLIEQRKAELAIRQQIAREHLLAEITQAIHQTFDTEQVLQRAVEGVRQFMQTDRAIIFRFNPDWSGQVVSESVIFEHNSILKSNINDPCFTEKYVEPYRQGRVSWVRDFLSLDAESCYKELMAQFQVRANLVVPILQRENLWGLLIAHHCRTPREWYSEEIELLQQLATQLGIAIQQAELYQKNAEQAALIDIASDAIFVHDLSSRILFWSHGAARLYGWKAEEVYNIQTSKLFNQEESETQLKTAFQSTIDQGNWNGELKQFTKTEQEIIVLSRWTLMRNPEGDPQSILVVNTDITEKKQLEKQLLHAQRLESIGTLAGGIAHDLNNILTPILGLTQLLPLYIPNLDQSSEEMLKMVRSSALRGADIVKQVLLFARKTETEWELLSIAEVMEETLKLIRETFPKSIAIEDSISANLWQIDGDSTQLHQVLMNLCVNARDAMPNGGKLIISASNLSLDEQYSATNLNVELGNGNYILITITDTGMGIPSDVIERIFEPFFTTKDPKQGTGLGLSTAIGIVKNHGGVIEVKSEPNKGTQFQIYLPVSKSEVITKTISDQTVSFGQGELILVVDDEAGIRKVTQATLEIYNYRVITASNGLEAIAIYAQQPQEIKVVLMDLVMPEMDGLTAMRALKIINPNVQLIATSGTATKEKVVTAESIGIKSFLLKPYTAETLLSHLNQISSTEI